MRYNIHTHHRSEDSNVLCIENISAEFDQDIKNRKVSMGLHPWYLSDQHSSALFVQFIILDLRFKSP
jgi:hypothetical protein